MLPRGPQGGAVPTGGGSVAREPRASERLGDFSLHTAPPKRKEAKKKSASLSQTPSGRDKTHETHARAAPRGLPAAGAYHARHCG